MRDGESHRQRRLVDVAAFFLLITGCGIALIGAVLTEIAVVTTGVACALGAIGIMSGLPVGKQQVDSRPDRLNDGG